MKKILIAILAVACSGQLLANNVEKITSVVKIFAIQSRPNFYQPWQNYRQGSSSGSGFIISDGRIVTNAHIVSNQTFLQVRKQGDPKKYLARLEVVGHECDLAILKVDDPNFYKGMPPLELGELPDLQDKVNVLGYPIGGDNISVTEGVISRIEPITYNHSGRKLLAVQIDAAMNPGNSGGPVVKAGKVVGVAFQGLSQAQSIGFMIPLPVIKHFLKDVADGKYDGFPGYRMGVMKMENPDLRKWAKMKDGDTGVLITYLSPREKAKNVLKKNDVLMAIDGIKIANDATIPFRHDEVIYFGAHIWQKYIGDTCKFKILRNGKVIEKDYPLTRAEWLVPRRSFDKLPTYYMIGGLLFVPLTVNYLDAWRNWWVNGPRRLVNYTLYGEIKKDTSQVVVLAEVLADETNAGYQYIKYQAVTKINGQKVKDLKDLIVKIESLKDDFIVLELKDHMTIVLDINKCRETTKRIMKRYRIPADRSMDLMK